jgi:hypothetical protein
VRARRHFESEHLFDRLHPQETVRDGGDVIEPVPVGRDHRIETMLRDLLHAPMQVADVAIEIDDGLAVEFENNAQDAVRRRMLRPHVQHHLGAVQQGLFSDGDFYLMHTVNCGFRIAECGLKIKAD